MSYRKLGRTEIVCSRLVFGCGAALTGGKAVRLLDRAFEAGINCYDVGSDIYYKGSERSLAPFMKEHREDIWVISKAPTSFRGKAHDEISVGQAREGAAYWTKLLEASLKDLKTDYVDAYSLMAVNNASLVQSEEIGNAFRKAREGGKVGHFGLSTHNNAQAVLEAAVKTGWYDLAMVAVTPGGWYDWDSKDLAKDTPSLSVLEPFLEGLRNKGIGLIGMKAVRHIAPKAALGKGDPTAFDGHYDASVKAWPFNPYQRSYAYVLAHGCDVVNADMQNFRHLEENLVVVNPDAVAV